VDVRTEADSNDITECPHDDKPTTGAFGFLILYSLHLFVVFALFTCCCSYQCIPSLGEQISVDSKAH